MDEDMVRKVARVARLELTDEEIERYAADLAEIMSAFGILEEAPAEETFEITPIPVENCLREDKVVPYPDSAQLRQDMQTKDDWVRGTRLT